MDQLSNIRERTNDYIKDIAQESAKELCGRYDLLFASQVVNKQGLLKDDVFKQITEKV